MRARDTFCPILSILNHDNFDIEVFHCTKECQFFDYEKDSCLIRSAVRNSEKIIDSLDSIEKSLNQISEAIWSLKR